jgi:hypothetical protein
MILEIFDVCASLQKPKEFMNDSLHEQALGSHRGETLLQIESHLSSEDADRPGAGAITFPGSVVENIPHKIKILLHDAKTSSSGS